MLRRQGAAQTLSSRGSPAQARGLFRPIGEAAVPRPQTLRTAKGCRAFSFERMRLRFELLVLRRQTCGLIFKIGMFRFQPADCGGRLLEWLARTQALQFLALPIVVSHAGAKLIDFRFEGMGALYS